MDELLQQNAAYFPFFFIGMWLLITTVLSFISGWFSLVQKYPDQPETPVLVLKNQSGSLRGVGMRSILNLSVCPSGLRIGMMRIFGPFSRPVFIPWETMSVTRQERFFQKTVKISIGQPIIATLALPAEVGDRLARAAAGRWPEMGEFPAESGRQTGARLFKQWLLSTSVAALFFSIVPRFMAPNVEGPPIAVAILFPAIVFGVVSFFRYLTRDRS